MWESSSEKECESGCGRAAVRKEEGESGCGREANQFYRKGLRKFLIDSGPVMACGREKQMNCESAT